MTETAERHRRRRPVPARARGHARHRGRRPRRGPQRDARSHRGGVRPARRLRGAPAPVRRRRLPRAAHARGDHPRLRRALPRRRARRRRPSSTTPCAAPSRRRSGWASLVDDLLHLARLDQGRPLERAPVDLVAARAGRRRGTRRRWSPTGPCAPSSTDAGGRARRPRPAPPGGGQPRRQRARARARRAHRGAGRARRAGRGRDRGGRRGPGDERRRRGAGVRALLPGRRLPQPPPGRQRARPVHRGGHGAGPRRPHVAHHRAGRRARPCGWSSRSRGRSRPPIPSARLLPAPRRSAPSVP